jgi:hypothetical protein
MSNDLTNPLKAQLFAQDSADPFLSLVTVSGPGFEYRLVNNTKDIVSNGMVYTAFPMKIRLSPDDGESARDFQIEFDNASLLLIRAFRAITEPADCQIDMVLASMPDVIQMTHQDLKIQSIVYDKQKVIAKIILDNFLTVAMTSERYTPSTYPGMF